MGNGGFDLFDPETAPRGVATLIKTPMVQQGRVDEASYARATQHVVDIGTCLAITGMPGSEAHSIPDADRVRCLEITLDICKDRVPVCAAVLGASIREVVAAAERAEKMGADLIAVVPPAWMRNEDDIATCIKTVASSIELPIMVHSIAIGGVPLSIERLARLPVETSNVRYLKEEAEYGPRRISQLLEQPGDEGYLRIMTSQPLVAAYLAGARLFMAAPDLIEVYMAVFDALEGGDPAEARRIEALMGQVFTFKRYVSGELANKVIQHRRGLFDSPLRASPSVSGGLTTLTPAEEEDLTEALRPLLPYFTKYPPRPPA
ncbi:MAG: hypothetical protein CL878_10745 [Dehalococcoidia bacterium]|nr:hypothetical protein [Dehalococcoidia bacterium]